MQGQIQYKVYICLSLVGDFYKDGLLNIKREKDIIPVT